MSKNLVLAIDELEWTQIEAKKLHPGSWKNVEWFV